MALVCAEPYTLPCMTSLLRPGMTAEETTKAVREGLAHAFVAVAMATQLAALVDDFVRSTRENCAPVGPNS